MIIDRHNYEEFFILYWDNELDAFQKKAVEDFVQANSDLQEEFTLLEKTRFIPEDQMVFAGKELLLRKSELLIDHSNYQEHLLSYIDGELNVSDRIEVQRFINSNPSIQSELALLQSTKFHPEQHIVFPDKSVLYRKEERPVLRMIWFRISVAAAILIIAGFFTMNLINRNSTLPGNTADIVIQGDSEQTEIKKNDNNQVAAPIITKDNPSVIAEVRSKQVAQPAVKRDEVTIMKTIPVTNDQVVINDNITQTDPNVVLPDEITDLNSPTKVKAKANGDTNISFAIGGVTERKSPAFYLENPEGPMKDNGGLKGLLRKATRVFERRTNIQTTTDDNKLLVGAFAVSLK